MNTCIICNEPLGSTKPIWGTTPENECHLDCTDALLDFVLGVRNTGNAYVKGVIEVLLTGARLEMERLRA